LRRVHPACHVRRHRHAERLRMHAELSRRLPRKPGRQRMRRKLPGELWREMLWQRLLLRHDSRLQRRRKCVLHGGWWIWLRARWTVRRLLQRLHMQRILPRKEFDAMPSGWLSVWHLNVKITPFAQGALVTSRAMSDVASPLALEQINIVVRDMQRSLTFYRLLGVSIEEVPDEWAEWALHHVNGVTSNGVRVDFDSVAFAKQWNPGLDETKLGSAMIPIFHVPSREEVDRIHARLTAAGHRSHKPPEDAFWGARYAIVEDPDGNSVGIMSPIDESKRRPPPPPPRT
jgi:catechol 2,3-dioxygenase-like lactoylglutathione lyase family enzyme